MILPMDPNAPNGAYFIGPDGLRINHLSRNTYMGDARAVLPDGRVIHVSDPYLWTIFDLYFDPAIHSTIRYRSTFRYHAVDDPDIRRVPTRWIVRKVAYFIDPNGLPVDHTHWNARLSDARLVLPDGRVIHICDPYIWEIFDQHLNPQLRPLIRGFQLIPFRGPPPSLTRARAHAPVAPPEHENTNPWIDVPPRRRRRAANVEGDAVGQAGGAAECLPITDKEGVDGGVAEGKRLAED